MEDNNENYSPKLEIRPTIDKKLFKDTVTEVVLKNWCEINTQLKLSVVSRDEYERKETENEVIRNEGNQKTLSLPNDLQLYEVPKIVEIIDSDTFPDQPERQTSRKEKIQSLGRLFRNSAIYIVSRLDSIDKGKGIASSLALDFAKYGYALENGRQITDAEVIGSLFGLELSDGETKAVDRFLAGESLYQSRQKRAESEISLNPLNKDDIYEVNRRQTLAEIFGTIQKAFELKQRESLGELKTNNDDTDPWKIKESAHSTFIKKIEASIINSIEDPKNDLYISIYDKGEKNLLEKMNEYSWRSKLKSRLEKMNINLKLQEKSLYESLKIQSLKSELEKVRQQGDLVAISNKEREIAGKIQNKIKKIPYFRTSNIPTDMIENQWINCVGASILGGALMSEVGLNYLVADVPRHSLLVLITSDGGVEWRDMILTLPNEKMTDDMIIGKKEDGSRLVVSDIVQYSQKPTKEGIKFQIDKIKYPNKFYWVDKKVQQTVVLREPKHGQQFQIMGNIGGFLLHPMRENDYLVKERTKAISFISELISITPENGRYYQIMSGLLSKSGDSKKAVFYCQKAISFFPDEANLYVDLGSNLLSSGQDKSAQKSFDKAISMTAEENYYSLGRYFLINGHNREAIKLLTKVVENNPKSDGGYLALAAAYFADGILDKVENVFDEANKNNPKYNIDYSTLGNFFRSFGSTENQIKANYLVVKENPKDESSYIELIRNLRREKRYEEEIIVANLAINNGIKSESIYTFLISSLSAVGNYKEAINISRQQVIVYPKSSNLYYFLGNGLEFLGEENEAKIAYQKSIDFSKDGDQLTATLAKMSLSSLNKKLS